MAQLIMGQGCCGIRLAPGWLGCGLGVCSLDGDKYSCRLLDAMNKPWDSSQLGIKDETSDMKAGRHALRNGS